MEKVKEKQIQRSNDYYSTFVINHVGQKVLQDLEEAFNYRCFDENPYKMAYLEGKRDVVLYIKERIAEYELERGVA